MTTVSTVTSGTATGSSPSALSSLTSNFDTFLSLLTTELKNQDPLNPMDTTDYITQLSQMCQVAAQIETNNKLDTLISLGSASTNNYAVNYLGKSVVLTDGTGVLSNGSVTWNYGLNGDAASTTLTVKDANGKTVYSESGETSSGVHTFTWDGTDSNGDQLADGSYTLTVTATDSSGTSVTTSVASKATVTGVDLSGGTPKLVIGSAEIALSDVRLIGE